MVLMNRVAQTSVCLLASRSAGNVALFRSAWKQSRASSTEKSTACVVRVSYRVVGLCRSSVRSFVHDTDLF